MPSILLIEDNHTILENTAELLEMEGYTIITATDGMDGYQKIGSERPDLIVCDILMPQMDGIELLGRLATDPKLKTIPLILYSAKSEKSDIKMGMDLGAYDYIVKPTDLNNLVASVQKCLRDRRLSE